MALSRYYGFVVGPAAGPKFLVCLPLGIVYSRKKHEKRGINFILNVHKGEIGAACRAEEVSEHLLYE
jgi:hypothetical protein